MTKFKKLLIIFLVICLTTGILWLYWESEFTLEGHLPDENWYKIQLHGVYFKSYVEYTVEEATVPLLLDMLQTAKVDRGPKFETLDGDALILWLYPGEKPPTQITVRADGRISVMAELRDKRVCYYEGGEALYCQLQTTALSLPAYQHIGQ
ncbi:MAG: hypothetical protein IKA16_00755 [Oscillospiraceae bacterium]|nr:hypothetical protein [Oscillospiraceae bacterium]